MRASDALRIAVDGLVANPLRTVLTMLGIIIGVGAVVSMAAIGAGAQARLADQIRTFGTNVLMIKPGAANHNGVRKANGTRHTLTQEDAQAIARLPLITAAAPSVYGKVQVVYRDSNWATTVNGTTPDHFKIRGWHLKSGQFFSRDDDTQVAKVAVIGSLVAEKLFKSVNPLGRWIRILKTPFQIVGVLAEKGTTGLGQSQDDVVFVPLPTARISLVGTAHTVNQESVAYILASARSEDAMPAAITEITTLLEHRHFIRKGQDKDFVVTTAAAMLAAQQASTRTVSMLLGAIAAVALVVGGISIMNIMLVSVTERTPEIGLRLAVGARLSEIRNQFLLEAVTLCSLGGVIGIGFGAASAIMVAKFVGWPVLIEPSAAIIAVGFAASIGIFFGYYPAKQAARLDPVTVLRAD